MSCSRDAARDVVRNPSTNARGTLEVHAAYPAISIDTTKPRSFLMPLEKCIRTDFPPVIFLSTFESYILPSTSPQWLKTTTLLHLPSKALLMSMYGFSIPTATHDIRSSEYIILSMTTIPIITFHSP